MFLHMIFVSADQCLGSGHCSSCIVPGQHKDHITNKVCNQCILGSADVATNIKTQFGQNIQIYPIKHNSLCYNICFFVVDKTYQISTDKLPHQANMLIVKSTSVKYGLQKLLSYTQLFEW